MTLSLTLEDGPLAGASASVPLGTLEVVLTTRFFRNYYAVEGRGGRFLAAERLPNRCCNPTLARGQFLIECR